MKNKINKKGFYSNEKDSTLIHMNFTNSSFLERYSFMFTSFKIYMFFNQEKDFLMYLDNYINTNDEINHSLWECNFYVNENAIEFLHNEKDVFMKNQGKFIVQDRFICNVCNSFLFIEDKNTETKYIYFNNKMK